MNPLAWLLARADDPAEAAHAAEIRAELEHHLACARAELERAGLSPAAAAVEAENRFGARERIEAECLAIHGGTMGTRLHAVVTALLLLTVLVLSFALYSSRAAAVAARDEAKREQEAAVLFLTEAEEFGRLPWPAIRSDDRVHIFTRSGDWQFDGTVDAEGNLSIPEVGEFLVEGLIRPELEHAVGAKLHETRPGIEVLALINATPSEVLMGVDHSGFPAVYEERR